MPLSKSEYTGIYRGLDTLLKTTEKAIHDNDSLLAKIEITGDFETDEDLQRLHSDEMADKTVAYGDVHSHLAETVKPFLMSLKPVVRKVGAPTPSLTPITPTPPITPPGPTPCARPCVVRGKPCITRYH